jgi:Glycosyl hydrolase family 10
VTLDAQWEPLLVKDSTGAEVYNFEHADKIMQWASHNGKIVKGHTLVWHVTSPQFIHTCGASKLREAVFEHIKTAMSHWYGQVREFAMIDYSVWFLYAQATASTHCLANKYSYIAASVLQEASGIAQCLCHLKLPTTDTSATPHFSTRLHRSTLGM